MAVVSSILSIEVDELGRPLNIKAFDSGDTIASGIFEDGVKTTLSSVNSSSIYWSETYYKVLDRSGTWEAGGEAQVPSDVSGKWQSAYDYLNSGGSATIGGVSSTVNIYSATWGAGGGAVPSDVSSKWQNAYDYLNNGASANIASTSATVSNASANWNSVYNRVLGTSGDWTSVYNRTLGSSGGWQNAFNYTSNASANITSTSAIILNGSSNWNSVYNRTLGSSGGWENAFVYLNTGASANIASTSATVSNASSNWNSVYNRVLGASGDWQNSYAFANSASANITSTSATVSNASANWNSVYNRTLGSSGGWQNAFNYASNSSATITSVSSSVFNTSSNWNSVYNRTLGSSGGWQNAFNYTSNASATITSVSSSVFNTSSNWNTAYTHSQIINANPHATDISSLDGVSLDIPGLQGGQFLKYKPGVGWTNDSIAITNVATGGFGAITNTSALTFSANQGLSVTAVGTTLTFAISGNVSGATSSTNAFSSTNALSATSALNAQQAPNGFNVTGTILATTVSATNYLNIRPNVSSVNSAATTSFTAGGDYDTYLINTTTTSVIAYLPEASSYTNKMITFSKVDDGGSYRSVTVSGAQLVTATNTVILYDPTESVTVISNGTNWYSLDYDRSYGVVFVCKNSTGATLTKGTPIRVSGATGANVLITPASAVNTAVPESPSGFLARVIGVVEHDIPDGEFGHVLTKGSLYKYNTNGFNEGDSLYLAASGGLTNIKPTPPYEEIFIGIVTRKQAVNGSLLIDIQNPEHINSIVGFDLASSISERDVIAYDLTTSTFKNYNPSSFNVSSATSATLALSATSALNAQRAPNGFTVTGTLTATTASATTYLNLPSSIATWNASALQGKTLNAAAPTINEILRYNGTQWINDSETQYSLNGELGAGWTINAASGINFTNTATNTFRITANYTSGIWNASALQGSPLSATLVPTTNQGLIYNGSVWTASTLPAVITDHGTLTGLSDNDHPQYVLSSTNNALSSLVNNHVASASVHFVMSSIDHTLIQNIGTNSHADIDNHISDQNNPHIVTAEQVGNSTAQWNASSLFGYEVKDINPNNEEILQWNNSTLLWVPTPIFNTTAKWNASAIAGSPLSATLGPTTGQSLVYNGTVWTASTVVATGGGGGGGIADASSLRGSPLSATLVPTAGQALMYNGSVWTASAALFAYTYGSGAPTGGSDGDIYLQTDVEALQVATVSATTYLNLPSSVITWTYATSATSALNAQQAPNGFTVTGTLSSTNLLTTSGDVSAVRLTDYSELKSAPTISSSSLTLDLNAAQVFTVSLNSNISTLTISNTESRANSVQGFTLILTADGTARTITWPGSVKWPSGTGPTLTSTNNKVDILSFVSPDNGTTWYGFIGGQNY